MREEISHRLRTPLTVIKTMLQYAERKWPDLSDEQKKEFVVQTLAQVEQLEAGIEVAETLAADLDSRQTVVLPEDEHDLSSR